MNTKPLTAFYTTSVQVIDQDSVYVLTCIIEMVRKNLLWMTNGFELCVRCVSICGMVHLTKQLL